MQYIPNYILLFITKSNYHLEDFTEVLFLDCWSLHSTINFALGYEHSNIQHTPSIPSYFSSSGNQLASANRSQTGDKYLLAGVSKCYLPS